METNEFSLVSGAWHGRTCSGVDGGGVLGKRGGEVGEASVGASGWWSCCVERTCAVGEVGNGWCRFVECLEHTVVSREAVWVDMLGGLEPRL